MNSFYSLEERERVDPASNEVEVEMMLSPVNPSDINQIQGIRLVLAVLLLINWLLQEPTH